MKTGIVRRVDDLGRVVLPREIRKSLHIQEGDPLEIEVIGETISLSLYRPLYEMESQKKEKILLALKKAGVHNAHIYDSKELEIQWPCADCFSYLLYVSDDVHIVCPESALPIQWVRQIRTEDSELVGYIVGSNADEAKASEPAINMAAYLLSSML